jgi:hypothetical protein
MAGASAAACSSVNRQFKAGRYILELETFIGGQAQDHERIDRFSQHDDIKANIFEIIQVRAALDRAGSSPSRK